MGRITLITGGARSGKSAHALQLASDHRGPRRAFIATAEPLDDEMAERIARHKASRSADFLTIEEPLNLENAVNSLRGRADLVVIDCLTLWVSNVRQSSPNYIGTFLIETRAVANAIGRAEFDGIVVTSEVGAGVVPDNRTAREFRDLLGWANQAVAQAADEVILMVAGYPLRVK
ncbi:MAG: bifunctional adenosylcobinamide kinase/adenosylcobinamide-phosphate guanylyltransferase [Candidatus Binataceae bacterium]